MNWLKKLIPVVALTLVLGVAGFGQTPSCEPGQTSTPPCLPLQMGTDDSLTPGELNTTPAASAADVFTIAEATIDVLLSALLF
jgi:hypothetical protein